MIPGPTDAIDAGSGDFVPGDLHRDVDLVQNLLPAEIDKASRGPGIHIANRLKVIGTVKEGKYHHTRLEHGKVAPRTVIVAARCGTDPVSALQLVHEAGDNVELARHVLNEEKDANVAHCIASSWQ